MATYFNACDSLTGWTEQGIVASTQFVDAGTTITANTSGGEVLTLDAVDSDADRQDAEILVKYQADAVPGNNYVAIVRGAGTTAATADGYQAVLRSGAIRIFSKDNNAITQIGTASFTTSINTWYWVRFRVNGTALKLRAWADGGPEPGTWNIEITDTTYSADGYVGITATPNASVTGTWGACGVGTNGDTAPSSGSTDTTGSLSVTLADVTVSAAGALTIAGSASNTLAAVGLSGAGAVAIAGSSSNALGAATLAGAGAVAITGSLAQTLVAAALSGAGALSIQGAAANTLGAVSLVASGYAGSVPITGDLAQTLGAVTASGAGQISIAGALAQTLGTASLSAAGTVAVAGVIGALDQQLGAVGLSAAGALPITGGASMQLGAASLLSSGGVLITGALAQVLAPLSISARGGETVIVVGALVGLLRAYPALAAAIDLDPALEATIEINLG